MLKWLKTLFAHRISPDQVIHKDEIIKEIVSRVWNSGSVIIAKVDEDGNVSYSDNETEKTPDDDISAGRIKSFSNIDDMLDSLKQPYDETEEPSP